MAAAADDLPMPTMKIRAMQAADVPTVALIERDRKSTRLNSSHRT